MDVRTTWPAIIGALIRGETLTAEETSWVMNEIMDGAATPSQIAGFGVAVAVALLFGGWLARAAAALDLVLLIVVGQIFAGLSRLQVSAVGHVTALATGALLGSFFWWRRRRKARSLFDHASVSAA